MLKPLTFLRHVIYNFFKIIFLTILAVGITAQLYGLLRNLATKTSDRASNEVGQGSKRNAPPLALQPLRSVQQPATAVEYIFRTVMTL